MTETLGARVAAGARRRFVGRAQELAVAETVLAPDAPAKILYVHGPAGIGKSALLRELATRARARGFTPLVVDGRDLPPKPHALEMALGGLRDAARPLLVLDTYERIAGLGGHLRRTLLPDLPEATAVVIASRRAPERGWREDGWETVTRSVELGVLSASESTDLLAALGVTDEDARRLQAWAAGSPLAVVLAADAATRPDLDADAARVLPAQLAGMAGALLEGELEERFADTLAVAAVARAVTAAMLGDVLEEPLDEARAALEWLAGRTFAERLGEGITLHDVVRRSLRADLLRRDGERERELRRRIADHLHARAVSGHPRLAIDLADLIEDRRIRWGFCWDRSTRYHVDAVREGDAEAIGAALEARGRGSWWAAAEPFVRDPSGSASVVRDTTGAMAGYVVAFTPAGAPPFAADDPVVGWWLRHARATGRAAETVIWRDAVDFTGDPSSGVQSMLGVAGVLRSGMASPRWGYLPINPFSEGAKGFAAALGAEHIPELDVTIGGTVVHCHVLDYGPGGLLALERTIVHRESGAEPMVAPDPDAVRDALRHLHEPALLALSPLARGEGQSARADSVAALLHEAAVHAFGDTPDELLLARVLQRGYLDPTTSHEAAAHELALSRSAYFRRLRTASDRVAAYLGGRPR